MIPILFACICFFDAPQITRLANGVPIITLFEKSTNDVSIQCLLKTTNLTYQERAFLQTLEATLFNETETLSKNRLAHLVAFVGQNANVEWSQDVLRIEVTTKSSHIEPAIAILSDILKRTVIQNSVDAQRHLHQLQRTNGSRPHEQAILATLAQYNIVPTQHPNLLLAHLQDTWDRLAIPQNLAIAIVGNFDREKTVQTLSASLSNWKGAENRTRKPVPPPPQAVPPAKFHLGGALIQGPKPDDPDFAAWLVLAYAIGEGKKSEVAQFARYEGGFAYATGLRIGFHPQGAWGLAWFLSTEPPEEASSPFLRRIQKAEWLERELIRARTLAIADYEHGEGRGMGAFRQGHTTLAERAFWLAWWELNGGYRWDAVFSQRLQEVTLERLRLVAEKWLPKAQSLDPS